MSPPQLILLPHDQIHWTCKLFFLWFCISVCFLEKGEMKHICMLPQLQNLACKKQISSLSVLLGQLRGKECLSPQLLNVQ